MTLEKNQRPRVTLITGGHNSGKSKMLLKEPDCIYLSAVTTNLVEFARQLVPDNKAMKQPQLFEELALFFAKTSMTLCIDDADKLSGKKLAVVRQLIERTECVQISCISENRLDPTIRDIIEERNPVIVRLKTSVSYDVTAIATGLLAVVAFALHMPEAGMIISALVILSRGRHAIKNT